MMYTVDDSDIALTLYQRMLQRFHIEDPEALNGQYSLSYNGMGLGMGYDTTIITDPDTGEGMVVGIFYLSFNKTEIYEFELPSEWSWMDGVPVCPLESLFEEMMEFVADYT